MANSNLVIKVTADSKDAVTQLKSLGYNVEEVKKKTKEANTEADLWDKTLQKASGDNIKNMINLGAKFLTVSTAANLAYRGLKSCVDEALKGNAEQKKKLEDIASAWTSIKANLGGALLDTITPALDTLYKKLKEIADWVEKKREESKIGNVVYSASVRGETVAQDVADQYSAEYIKKAIEQVKAEGYDDFVVQNLTKAYDLRIKSELASTPKSYDISTFDGTLGGGKMTLQEALNRYSSSLTVTDDGRASAKDKYKFYAGNYSIEYGKYLNESGTAYWDETTERWTDINNLMEKTDMSLQEALNNFSSTLEVQDDGRAAAKAKYAFYSGNYSDEYGKYLNQSGTAYWDEETGRWTDIKKLAEDADKALEDTSKTLTTTTSQVEEAKHTWKDYFSSIADYASGAFSAMTSLSDTYYDNQLAELEESGASEEDIAAKEDEINKKKFEADKANSIAQALIDTASSIMSIWAEYGAQPAYAGVLTGIASATSAMQIAAISGQKYTGFAEGGIVSSPTRALIGEGAEKEAIMPLSKLEDFVTPNTSEGTIVININMTDGSNKTETAEAVYYAIERAQRTGLLPNWRYTA